MKLFLEVKIERFKKSGKYYDDWIENWWCEMVENVNPKGYYSTVDMYKIKERVEKEPKIKEWLAKGNFVRLNQESHGFPILLIG